MPMIDSMTALTDLTLNDIHYFRGIDEEGSPDLLNELIGGEVVVRGPMDGDGCHIWSEISRLIIMRSGTKVRRAYGAAGIPLYLLIDRNHREHILFSQPDVEAQDYRADIRVPFGSDLELPAPFSFTLTDFLPPTV